MDGHSIFDPTFMVGLAFILLCIALAKPGWKMWTLKLKEHRNSVAKELQEAQHVLEEAKVRLEYAEALLEQFEGQKTSVLQQIEHQISHMEVVFQAALAKEEHRENLRIQAQCNTLREEWKQEASARFMCAVRTQLSQILQGDVDQYAQINSAIFSNFLTQGSHP
jgi:F0F1-type ATP synthase membrane subunit b/b'